MVAPRSLPSLSLFASVDEPRYNPGVLFRISSNRLSLLAPLPALALWASSCAVPLGPGYTIEKQTVNVSFVSDPDPRIIVEANYDLRNTGTQPLSSLELRLPGPRRFHVKQFHAEWGGAPLQMEVSTGAVPRARVLSLPAPWAARESRHLRLSFEVQRPVAGESQLNFAADAFYLPAEGWNPELLPAQGMFGTGGIPPKKWKLSVRVPRGFLIHASGHEGKTARGNGEKTVLFIQHPKDHYPFVLAGQYTAARFESAGQTIYIWARDSQDQAALRQTQESLTRAITAYDAAFGARRKDARVVWIVECPVEGSCAPRLSPAMTRLLLPQDRSVAEVASLDSVLVDLSTGFSGVSVAAAPSLAASWLGYGQNPRFWEQDPPLSALPAFAAALGREAVEGPQVRNEIIRRAVAAIPPDARAPQSGQETLSREKSLLFFYALQDQYGQQAFSRALRHMIQARRERGFELDDLIASLEQETHQDVAAFVRLWLKHPGIPQEFRARYASDAAPGVTTSKEKLP